MSHAFSLYCRSHSHAIRYYHVENMISIKGNSPKRHHSGL